MNPTKQNAPPAVNQSRGASHIARSHCNTSRKKPTKISRVMKALMERSYNRFEAARQLSDWCLHSTVSTIQSKGVIVHRQFETVPGYGGSPTKCCRYWIKPDQHNKAIKLLERW